MGAGEAMAFTMHNSVFREIQTRLIQSQQQTETGSTKKPRGNLPCRQKGPFLRGQASFQPRRPEGWWRGTRRPSGEAEPAAEASSPFAQILASAPSTWKSWQRSSIRSSQTSGWIRTRDPQSNFLTQASPILNVRVSDNGTLIIPVYFLFQSLKFNWIESWGLERETRDN